MAKTKLEQYAELQPFIQKEIETVAGQLVEKKFNDLRFSNLTTPLHYHNGIDSPLVPGENVVPPLRGSGSISLQTTDTRYTLNLTNTPNQILFYGNAVRRQTVFTVTAANATAGATYTRSGRTFQVITTISGGTTLTTAGNGVGLAGTGTLVKASGTGDASITYSAVASTSIDIRASIVGSAQLGSSYFFQPVDTTTVSPSNIIGNIIQSSSMLLINSSGVGNPAVAIASEGHIISAEFPSGTIVARATIPNVWTKADWSAYTDKGYGPGFVFLDVSLAPGWQIDGNFVVT